MYEAYYNLSTAPFRLTPDHTFRFAHTSYSQVFTRLEQAFRRSEGLVVLTGELGAGKTLMFNELCAKHVDERVRCARITTTQLDSEELLCAIALEYGIECEHAGGEELLRRLKDFLQHQAGAGLRCVLMIDEAQDMPHDAVARVAELSRLRVAGGRPLLQVFLAGSPEFVHRLRQVDVVCGLAGMDASETRRYIEHRLRRAGWRGDPKITVAAMLAVHERTRGIPRSINLVCSRLLLIGASEGKHELDVLDVTKVMEDLGREIPFVPADQAPPGLTPLRLPESEPAVGPPEDRRLAPVLATASDRSKEAEREIVRVPPRPAVPPAAAGTPSTAAAVDAVHRHRARRRTIRYAVAGSFMFAVTLLAASYQGGFDSLRRLLGEDRAEAVTDQAAVAIERQMPESAPPAGIAETAPHPGGADTASGKLIGPEETLPAQSARAGGDESGEDRQASEEPAPTQELINEPAQAQIPAESGIAVGLSAGGMASGAAGGARGLERLPNPEKTAGGSTRMEQRAEVAPRKAQVQPKAGILVPPADRKTASAFSRGKGQGADSSTNLEIPRARTARFERPDIERLVVGRPDFERVEIPRPDVARPDVERPDVERPDVERPDVARPDVERPKVERPDVERADIERPKIERPKIERPKIERPEIERPEIERPKFERPEIERPKIERPKFERPKIERPDIERPDRGD